MQERFRALPAVGAVLRRASITALIDTHGLARVTRAAREVIDAARNEIRRSGSAAEITDALVERRVLELSRESLAGVINATGVIVHTNLGRVPLAQEAIDAIDRVASDYSTLEYDLEAGERGHRHVHVKDALIALTGAEDALVVNNNAAALLLALAATAGGRDAIVSRGELVEIGGGFRVPDVVSQSGARLVEVGTTNRTHAADYERAIDERSAVLLKVHRSNFEIKGFVAEVALETIAAIAHAHRMIVIDDAGSGCMDAIAAITSEPSVRERIAAGADIVCFSGDKLLGGPQAGIVVGRASAIASMRRHPLYRALRPDKLTLAALLATLALWRDRPDALPIVRMLRASLEALDARSHAMIGAIGSAELSIAPSIGRIGGGAAPSVELPSVAIRIAGPRPDALATALRRGEPAVIARIEDDAVWIDLRCVAPDRDDELARAIALALRP